MGWEFPWVSSGKNSFNQDDGVYFTDRQREKSLAGAAGW